MRRRVTVVVLCVCVCVCLSVCLSVTTKSAAYPVFTSQTKLYRVLYGVFNDFTVLLSLKTLRSSVMASFAGHRFLPRPLANFRRPNETAVASFQLEKYIWLVIDPTTRLVHHWSYYTGREASWLSLALHATKCWHSITHVIVILLDITQSHAICILVVTLTLIVLARKPIGLQDACKHLH